MYYIQKRVDKPKSDTTETDAATVELATVVPPPTITIVEPELDALLEQPQPAANGSSSIKA